jgi:hypothetical protein
LCRSLATAVGSGSSRRSRSPAGGCCGSLSGSGDLKVREERRLELENHWADRGRGGP